MLCTHRSGTSTTWSSTDITPNRNATVSPSQTSVGEKERQPEKRHRLFTWLQFVDPLWILNQDLVLFFFRNSLEAPFQPFVGRRPDRRRVREVRLPQDPVDANIITQLNTCLLVPEVDVALLAEDIAWLTLEPVFVKLVAFPFVVAGFKHVRNPSDAALCANEGQLWEALKHAAEQEIGKNL